MSKNNKTQEKILTFFFRKFKISPTDALYIIQQWHNQNPDIKYEVLEASLKNNLVTVINKKLVYLFDERIIGLVNDMRGEDGIEIKDRKYNFLNYPKCFVGSEAVRWMQKQYLLSPSAAVSLGQELINLQIIHHVADDHDFKNDYLFYSFYIDE